MSLNHAMMEASMSDSDIHCAVKLACEDIEAHLGNVGFAI